MKIVHILPSLKGGGIQNFIFSLAPRLVQMGNEVIIMVTDEDNIEYSNHQKKMLEQCNIRVINLNRKIGSRISFLRTIRLARKSLKAINADIINTHGTICHTIAAFSSIGLRCKHCCTIHSAPETWSKFTKIINRNKPLIYCSNSALILRGQKGSPMIAINNGIDYEKVCTSKTVNLRDELNIPKEDKVVVLVGSTRPPKNYPFLIKVVEKIKNQHIHFCICGGSYKVERNSGNNKNYISTVQFEKYDNIHLLGLRDDVMAILNGSDVYMSCSIREGLPISALEAFASGIPCVLSPIMQHTTIAEGIAECYIPQEFTETSFIDSIHQALNCALDHKTIYNQRELALQKFSIERCAREYNDFYYKLLKK